MKRQDPSLARRPPPAVTTAEDRFRGWLAVALSGWALTAIFMGGWLYELNEMLTESMRQTDAALVMIRSYQGPGK